MVDENRQEQVEKKEDPEPLSTLPAEFVQRRDKFLRDLAEQLAADIMGMGL